MRRKEVVDKMERILAYRGGCTLRVDDKVYAAAIKFLLEEIERVEHTMIQALHDKVQKGNK